jgi:FAD/FMN-containing dehydrogenase
LSRRFGLTCDNVRSIDLVNARARFATVSDQTDKELFWGLRGGGGNFGVATSFELNLHPVDPVMVGGEIAYSWDDAPAALAHYFDFCATAPDELNVDAVLMRLPNDVRFLSLDICWSGARDRAEAVLKPLREFRKPIRDTVAAAPYAMLQKSADETLSHGHKYYIKAGFVQKHAPALIEAVVATVADAKLPAVQAVLMPQGGGAIARVKPGATAFAQRAATHSAMVLSRWDDPALSDAIGAWTRESWKKLDPLTHGFYVNDYTPDDAARMGTTYGANFNRLVALKTKVDPNNLFRLNANLMPPKKA